MENQISRELTLDIDDVKVVDGLYPRLRPLELKIEEYRDNVESAPAIIVARGFILVDGYHRWQAHKRNGATAIRAIDLGDIDDDEILAEAVRLNARHGHSLTPEEKRRLAPMLVDGQGKTIADAARCLAVSDRSVRNWVNQFNGEQVKARKATERAERERKIAEAERLRAQGLKQQQIAEQLDVSRPWVAKHLLRPENLPAVTTEEPSEDAPAEDEPAEDEPGARRPSEQERAVELDGKSGPSRRFATEWEASDEVTEWLLDANADDVDEACEAGWYQSLENDLAYEAIAIVDQVGLGEVDLRHAVEELVESKRLPITKPDLGGGISHPARYSDELMPHFVALLHGYRSVLDPFGGTGKIHALEQHGHDTIAVEIEPEWAKLHARTLCGSALDLPFDDEAFDAICTSPTYGNRLADKHNASDPHLRRSYTHDLGRPLHEDNSGGMQWGGQYMTFHRAAWAEAVRVLKPGGRFVLNIKDHIRAGEWQDVAGWHVDELCRLGLTVAAVRPVVTSHLRQGANGGLRVPAELVVAFDKPDPDA